MTNDFRICTKCNQMSPVSNRHCVNCDAPFSESPYSQHFLNETLPDENDVFYLLDGTIIEDRFRIDHFIGKGPNGKVYSAEDLSNGGKVALKVIIVGPNGKDAGIEKQRQNILVNVRTADHAHVVRWYDIRLVPWEGISLLTVAMEFAEAGTFGDWINRNKEDHGARLTEGIMLFKQVCLGISALHQQNSIHLNLKPENLLFLDGRIKVSDHGLAALISKAKGNDYPTSNKHHRWQGTPAYMSPEHFLSSSAEGLDTRSDIYSLGVTLFELVHPDCCLPFSGTYEWLQEQHLEVRPPRVPGVDEKLNSIIANCLTKRPEKRCQTVDELMNAISSQTRDVSHIGESRNSKANCSNSGIDELWEDAYRQYVKGNFQGAGSIADEILGHQADHLKARVLKRELENKFIQAQRLYDEIAENIHDNIEASLSLLKEAITIYPDHPAGLSLQTKLALRVKKFKMAMEEGLLALQNEQWPLALELFNTAIEIDPGLHKLKPLIENLSQIVSTKNEMEIALRSKDFQTALHLARLIDNKEEELKQHIPSVWGD